MKKTSIVLLILIINQFVIAQNDKEITNKNDNEITCYDWSNQPKPNGGDCFYIADIDATPKCGFEKWYKCISKYCNDNYPEIGIKEKIEGKIYLSFVIEKNGDITYARIIKGIVIDNKYSDKKFEKKVNGNFGKVALDALNIYDNWKPAKHEGKRVRLLKRLPMKFVLNDAKM